MPLAEFVPAQTQSTLGGLTAREALAQQFDVWKIRALPGLDPRVTLEGLSGLEAGRLGTI